MHHGRSASSVSGRIAHPLIVCIQCAVHLKGLTFNLEQCIKQIESSWTAVLTIPPYETTSHTLCRIVLEQYVDCVRSAAPTLKLKPCNYIYPKASTAYMNGHQARA
jgi:hypothetical protein